MFLLSILLPLYFIKLNNIVIKNDHACCSRGIKLLVFRYNWGNQRTKNSISIVSTS